MPVNASADLGQIAGREPGAQQPGDQIPPLKPAGFGVKVKAHDLGDLGARLADLGDRHQRAPLPRGQRNDHHPAAVTGLEIVAERAVQVIAVLEMVLPAELRLGDPPEIADHRERDV